MVSRLLLPYVVQDKDSSPLVAGTTPYPSNISMWRQQNKVVREITKDTVMQGSWFAHSEMILQTILSSDNEEDRRFAIKKILEDR